MELLRGRIVINTPASNRAIAHKNLVTWIHFLWKCDIG
jgi:hypothetical protein